MSAYWTRIFERMRLANRPDSWAYPWVFSNFARGALTIVPNVNLIANIGFGTGATHTERDVHGHADLPVFDPGELRHPGEVAWDEAMDRQLFDHAYGGARVRAWHAKEQRLTRRLKWRWDALRMRVGLKR
jgi:hypothetical protein